MRTKSIAFRSTNVALLAVRTAPDPGKKSTVWNGGLTFFGRNRLIGSRSPPYAGAIDTISRRH